jgi:hypothetical protein
VTARRTRSLVFVAHVAVWMTATSTSAQVECPDNHLTMLANQGWAGGQTVYVYIDPSIPTAPVFGYGMDTDRPVVGNWNGQ